VEVFKDKYIRGRPFVVPSDTPRSLSRRSMTLPASPVGVEWHFVLCRSAQHELTKIGQKLHCQGHRLVTLCIAWVDMESHSTSNWPTRSVTHRRLWATRSVTHRRLGQRWIIPSTHWGTGECLSVTKRWPGQTEHIGSRVSRWLEVSFYDLNPSTLQPILNKYLFRLINKSLGMPRVCLCQNGG